MPPKGYKRPVVPPLGTITAPAPKPRRRWEYTTLSAERPLTAKQYEDYGADGWELVSVYVRMDTVHAVFKREVL